MREVPILSGFSGYRKNRFTVTLRQPITIAATGQAIAAETADAAGAGRQRGASTGV
jgi:hypothetical protein